MNANEDFKYIVNVSAKNITSTQKISHAKNTTNSTANKPTNENIKLPPENIIHSFEN